MIWLFSRGNILNLQARIAFSLVKLLSRREKKAAGLEQHKKLQREKDLKRKQKRQMSLPAKHSKGKK
jgi:hypothetical protein